MTITKKSGIWMDHTSANLIEFTAGPIETKTIDSKFTQEEKEQTLGKSENLCIIKSNTNRRTLNTFHTQYPDMLNPSTANISGSKIGFNAVLKNKSGSSGAL